MWIFQLLTIWTTYQAFAQKSQIHKRMTKEELRHIFHVESHNQVPEYELIRVKRENDVRRLDDSQHILNLRFKAFGSERELNLKSQTKPSAGSHTPIWEASVEENGENVNYRRIDDDNLNNENWRTYQDLENGAAILLTTIGNTSILEGTIGHDLVLKPLPASFRDRTNVNYRDYLNEIEDSNQNGAVKDDDIKHRHIIYRRHLPFQEHYSDYAFMEPDDHKRRKRSARFLTTKHRKKREAPYVIFPEILVIVDYDGYRLHGGDNVQIKRYFVSFWNGVDMRYKLLKGPKVRISIAGIIISRGRDATPYLERNRVGRDAIDSAAALTDMGKYLFRERRLPVYDIAVAITKSFTVKFGSLEMVFNRNRSENSDDPRVVAGISPGDESCNTRGFAYVGGACVVNKRLEKVNSVAIIEDTGGFSGIIVAAHEVGHLLGAVHDGSPPPSYLGGPGAEKCRWEDGYIMSDLRHTEKGFRWSSCSVSSFHHFLNGDTATCLYNSPHEDESLPRVLPGKLLSLDAQCRRDRGTSACFKDDRVCAQLFCFDAGSGYCVAYRPAAEGSPCGDGQYCNSGRCVAEHENIIPDYSQHTPTYLRRSDDEKHTKPIFITNTTTESYFNFNHFDVTTKNYLWKLEPTTSGVKATLDETSCIDKAANSNCYDFVNRYGKQYCGTNYLKKNCCAAQKYLCPQLSL